MASEGGDVMLLCECCNERDAEACVNEWRDSDGCMLVRSNHGIGVMYVDYEDVNA